MSLADDVAAIVLEVLGDAVLGICEHGSAVLGGLRWDSDVDVLAIVDRPTTPAERRAIVERLLAISGPRAARGPARPVELTVVVQGDVRPWQYPPRLQLLYGEWLRGAFEAGHAPEPGPAPDLGPVLTLARRAGRALYGPPPADLLDPVPQDDLRRAIVAGVPGLIEDLETDTRNVLLTLARIWLTLATGDIATKDAAAAWAVERLDGPDAAVLRQARAIYLGETPEAWGDLRPSVRRCALRLVAEIDRLAPPAG